MNSTTGFRESWYLQCFIRITRGTLEWTLPIFSSSKNCMQLQ